MSLRGGVSACLDMLARCREAANSGRWQSLAEAGNDYMTAFEQLKSDIAHGRLTDEEDMQAMQDLEREQRQLIRLVRQRQQAIQDQLQVLGDARKRLNRMQDMSQAIDGGRL